MWHYLLQLFMMLTAAVHNVVGVLAEVFSMSVAVPLCVVMVCIFMVGLVQADASITVEQSSYRPQPAGLGEHAPTMTSQVGKKWITVRCTARATKYAVGYPE